jgi:TPR repeat protein
MKETKEKQMEAYESKKDYVHSFPLIRKLAKAGNPVMMRKLAGAYHHARGTEENFALAYSWMKKSAEAGDVLAMYFVSVFCLESIGTKWNPQEAFFWAKKAAEGQDPEWLLYLADFYEDGTGTAKSGRKALNLIRKAIVLGDPDAYAEMGELYRQGIGKKKDAKKAILWYRKAIRAGSLTGMARLGKAYLWGEGIRKNEAKGYRLLKKAAGKENYEAIRTLADDAHILKPRPKEAVFWLKKATDFNDPEASYNLSFYYRDGKGVRRDLTQYFQCLSAAAQENYFLAFPDLIKCYQKGIGTEICLSKAKALWKRGKELKAEYRNPR